MVEGWEYALGFCTWGYNNLTLTFDMPITDRIIQNLGHIVEPRENRTPSSYRKVNVWIGRSMKAPYMQVPRLMGKLIEAWDRLSSDEWYWEYEEIHPFADGNGRTGNILWNLHRGSIAADQLAFPPDFWGDKRLEFPK
jgi:hypothetical protein